MRIRWPWHRQAEPVVEAGPEPPAEPEEEPAKALTHVLEWVPMGWASVEVDRGDGGGWSLVSHARLHFAHSRYGQLETELQRTLEEMQADLNALQGGNGAEWARLENTLAHFSKIRYRVREWEEQESNWQRHSMGMERPLLRIMAKLIESGVPVDRVLVREITEGEG